MLLTSSQVSVAITSFIVFFFTTALFLAGYVLQQQTVRDIRAVIKPQLTRANPGGPELFLPPQFRDDGYLVDVIVDPVLPPKEEEWAHVADIKVKESLQEEVVDHGEDIGSEDSVDEEMIGATRWQKAARKKQLEALKAQKDNTAQKAIMENKPGSDLDDHSLKSEAQKQEEKLSRAERRKKIKEQILADGEGESFKGYRRRMW